MAAGARVAPELPERALAVYAHPDDAEVSCGGTLARWARAGCEVHLLVCTDGGKGSLDPSTEPGELARRRAGEVAEAAARLGLASHRVLGFADGELEDTPGFREILVGAIRRLRPEAVVCPDPTALLFGETYVNHRDHRVAGAVTLDAVSPAAANPHYFPGAGPPHSVAAVYLSGTLDPNVWVDVGDTIEDKIEALLCHRSQLAAAAAGHEGGSPEWMRTVVRQRAAEGGQMTGVQFAEGFRRLTLVG